MKTITISKTYKFDKYMPDKNCFKLFEEMLLRSMYKSCQDNTKIIDLFDIKIENYGNKKLINGKVTYDKYGGQYFWINEPNGNQQMLCEMRGWGHIQHMFPMTKEGQEEAAKYQDEVGNWIAKAINEKLERETILPIQSLTEGSEKSQRKEYKNTPPPPAPPSPKIKQ